MKALNTIQKGDKFRDRVSGLLAAAGFNPANETREDFKKVDIRCSKDNIDGMETFFVETKDYEGTLSKKVCIEFVTEYGTLVSSGKADRAWLISKNPISPDGRGLIENNKDLRCYTIEEFQRRLFRIDAYLQEIVTEFEHENINEYYIPPYTENNENLEIVVREWIDEKNAPPLTIMGGYGKGKSTFAKKIAYSLAQEALNDRTKRVPVLVKLGQIVDQQSIESLICTLFSSQHRAEGFHYSLFQPLNKAGQFLIILDGFDEMKHGMTFHTFHQNWKDFMKLDVGDAKILILGRDTVLHDDKEFKSIIEGKSFTRGGQEIPQRDRRECRAIKIRGFTLNEAKEYIYKYFPIKARESFKHLPSPPTADWIDKRIQELRSNDFDGLLERPVHAQMLCEIATQPEAEINNMSRYDLYDRFVHYLLDRELDKAGRYSNFTIDIRRQFNSELAWWLWSKGAASTTSLSDVPFAICSKVVTGVSHDFDDTGLKRELTAGCLIEKSSDTIYFGHRSIQEFLVADYLYETNLMRANVLDIGQFTKAINTIDAEIVEFILTRTEQTATKVETAHRWLSYLDDWRVLGVSLQGFELFVGLAKIASIYDDRWKTAWHTWLTIFLSNGQASFKIKTQDALEKFEKIFAEGIQKKNIIIQAALLHALSRILLTADRPSKLIPIAYLIALWIPREGLKMAVNKTKGNHNDKAIVSNHKQYALWAFLNCYEIISVRRDESYINIDVQKLQKLTRETLGYGLALESAQNEGESISYNIRFTIKSLYAAYGRLSITEKELDDIRPFFNDEKLRKRIMPLKIEVVRR